MSNYGLYSLGGKQLTGEKGNNFQQWELHWGDSNEIIEYGYPYLVAHCLTAFHEMPLVRAAVRSYVDNVVGKGFYPQSVPDNRILNMGDTQRKSLSNEIEQRFYAWAEKNSFFETQSLIYQSSKVCGDSLMFLGYDKKNKQITLQPSESIVIDSQYNNDYNKLGILLNSTGTHKGIRLDKAYAPNIKGDNGKTKKELEIYRYGEKSGRLNYILYFRPERPNQLRGYPLCYSVVNQLKNLDRYLDAETKKAVLSALFFSVYKSDTNSAGAPVKGISKQIFDRNSGDKEYAIKDGASARIGTNESLDIIKTNQGSQEMATFFDVMAQITGAATGVPKEQLLRWYQASYTASLGARTDALMTYEPEQAHFSKNYCQAIYREWLKNEILQGRIKTDQRVLDDYYTWYAFSQCKWEGVKMKHLNPLQEVKADTEKLNLGVVLPEDVINKYNIGSGDLNSYVDKAKEQYAKMEDIPKVSKKLMEAVTNDKGII